MKFPEWPPLTDESPQPSQHSGLIVDQQQAQGPSNRLRSGRGGILHDARSSAKSGPFLLRKIPRRLESLRARSRCDKMSNKSARVRASAEISLSGLLPGPVLRMVRSGMYEYGLLTLAKIVTTLVVSMSVVPMLFLLLGKGDRSEPKEDFDSIR